MTDLVRFGVAMDRSLLEEFDRRIAAKGYENRSEALRDLVRADLTRAAWDGGMNVCGTLTLVYSRSQAEAVTRLVEQERAPGGTIVSSMSVTLDQSRNLEVFILRGPGAELARLSGRLTGTKGVLAGELSVAAADINERP